MYYKLVNCAEENNIVTFSSQLDVATDTLLDFKDTVNVVVETNGNVEEEHLDNHMSSETNNNPAWVRFFLCFYVADSFLTFSQANIHLLKSVVYKSLKSPEIS